MPSPNKTKTTLKKEFLFCTFHEKFPPFTIPFDMPEPDTNYYMHFRFDFFLNKNRQNLFSPRIVLFFPFFSIVLGYLTPQATLHTSWLRAQLPSFFRLVNFISIDYFGVTIVQIYLINIRSVFTLMSLLINLFSVSEKILD